MRKALLVGVMAASVVTVVLVRPDSSGPTEEEIVAKLPSNVQALLAGGLCDNIHEVFLQDVLAFPMIPYANRPAVQDRISYYREWLRRKGCG